MSRVWHRLLAVPAAAVLAAGTASAQHHGGGGHAGGGHAGGGHPGGHAGHPGGVSAGAHHAGYPGGAYNHSGYYGGNRHYGYGGYGGLYGGYGYGGFGLGYPYYGGLGYGGLGYGGLGYGGLGYGGLGYSGLGYGGGGYYGGGSGYGYGNYGYSAPSAAVLGVPATVLQTPEGVGPPSAVTSGYSPLNSQPPASTPSPYSASTDVIAPDGAMVTLSGTPADTLSGPRHFTSPPLQPGQTYTYKAWATWTENGKPVTREKSVDVQAGQRVTIDMTTP